MKKMNKKGFTIVELVIVIAVIAILAGVMIPTFSGIVEKANASRALQEARNVYTEVYAEDVANDGVVNGTFASGYTKPTSVTTYTTNGGKVSEFKFTAGNNYTVTFNGTTWTTAKPQGGADSSN